MTALRFGVVKSSALLLAFSSRKAVLHMSSPAKPKVCIVGGGNAGHALAALLPFQGYETTMFCPYADEAERIQAGMESQGGHILAKFASHNKPSGDVCGSPKIVSKQAADVIPDCDVMIMPMPSFAYPTILNEIKPYLKEGQTIIVTPGQGGFDWFAKEILGPQLMSKIVICGLMPMPFNCRIETYGQVVGVQQIKTNYSIGVTPREALPNCLELVSNMFGGAHAEAAGQGSFLECTLWPINAVLHPARLRTLLADWKPGTVLQENPLFYEDMTAEATAVMDGINHELIAIGEGLTKLGIKVEIPSMFDWLAVYVYSEPKDSNLQRFFQTSDAYKGFKCPLVPEGDGFVPDFGNRYFTEDISLGLCGYKGIADICGVDTPVITGIIEWAQGYMNKEYVVDGRLTGKDLDGTDAPQRFGITTIQDLQKLYN